MLDDVDLRGGKMIVAINFSDEKYINAQKLNSKTAKKWGADRVIEYSIADIDEEFKEANKYVLNKERGAGYWLWKPYFILKTLSGISEGDYIIYSDSGAAFVNKIEYLVEIMERDNTDVMPFCITQPEIKWTKRDVFVLLDADREEIINSEQICGTYILIKKTKHSVDIIKKWLESAKDARMITDDPNVMGREDYREFIENRHDQSIWSVLCKKNEINPYRDPSQYGLNEQQFPVDVRERSTYPQIIESHRQRNMKYIFQLNYSKKWYHRVCRMIYENIENIKGQIHGIIKK